MSRAIEKSPAQCVENVLSRFSFRQSRLLTAKGTAQAVIVLLACAAVVILLDSVSLLSEPVRRALSLATYVSAFAVAWMSGLYRLFRKPSLEQIALSVEQSHPDFRESLLATVELRASEAASGRVHHSKQFVSTIETKVASELSSLRLSDLLPWSLVARSCAAATGILSLVVLLCFVPQLQLPERLARALVPFWEVERPSKVQIRIVDPSPADLEVPAGQVVAFVIEVSGDIVDQATIELQTLQANGNTNLQQIEMKRISLKEQTFNAMAPIGDRPVRYRFLAGDKRTRFYDIQPVGRPKAIGFRSTVTFPEYTHLAPIVVEGETGNLRVLQGCRISLNIESNQELGSAKLNLERTSSGETDELPMKQLSEPNRFESDFAVDENLRYQLKLASRRLYRDQPIENTFSPVYQIDSVVDQAPVLSWEPGVNTLWTTTPREGENFFVAPDEILTMSASVRDELPVSELRWEFAVNRGPWRPVPIDSDAIEAVKTEAMATDTDSNRPSNVQAFVGASKAATGSAKWKVDLIPLKVSNGDMVELRVAAVDRKDQTGYSSKIQLGVVSKGFERDRHRELFQKASLVGPLTELAVWLNVDRERIRDRCGKLRDPNVPREDKVKTLDEMRTFAKKGIVACDSLRELIESVLAKTSSCIDQNEIELLGRLVSRIEQDDLQAMIQLCDIEFYAPGNNVSGAWYDQRRERSWNRLIQRYDLAEQRARVLSDACRSFVTYDTLVGLTKDLTYLQDFQRDLTARKIDDFDALCRSQKVAEQYMDAIMDLSRAMEVNVTDNVRARFAELHQWLEQSRMEIRDLCDTENTQANSVNLQNRIQRMVEDLKYRHWAFHLDGGLFWSVQEQRRNLIHQGGSLASIFIQFFDQNQRRVEAFQDKSLDTVVLRERLDWINGEVIGEQMPALGMISQRRDLHQKRKIFDPDFASDMGMAARAWNKVFEVWMTQQVNSDETVSQLREIASAYRVLEAAHETVEARNAVMSLKPIEQYQWQTIDGRLVHIKQWDSVSHRIEFAQQLMREAGFRGDIADQFNGLRWTEPFNQAQTKLAARRDANANDAVCVADDLEKVLELWKQADVKAQPTIDAARAVLAKYAPSIAELARTAAEETKILKEKTEQLTQPESAASEVVQQQQERVNERAGELEDALIEMASKQSLLDEKQIEVARDSDKALKLVETARKTMSEAIDKVFEPAESEDENRSRSEAPVDPNENQQQKPQQQAQKNQNDGKNDPNRDSEDQRAMSQQDRVRNAIQRESDAIRALETVAKHFDALDKLQNEESTKDGETAESGSQDIDEALKEAEKEADEADTTTPQMELDREYEEAQKLAEQANEDPEKLLKRLEEELRKNPLMQQELSNISKKNAEDAVASLKNAASQEESIARTIESSDAELSGSKKAEVQKLRSAAQDASQLAVALVNMASQAAGRAAAKDEARSLNRAAEELRTAAHQVAQTPENASTRDLEQQIEKLSEKLQATQEQVAKANEVIEPNVEKETYKIPNERQRAIDDARIIQNSFRDQALNQARSRANNAQQAANHFQQQVAQKQTEVDERIKQRGEAKKNLEKNENDSNAKDWYQRATRDLQQSLQSKKIADALAEQAKSLSKESDERVERIEKAQREELDRPNPYAALANEKLKQSKEELAKLSKDLQAMSATQLPDTKASEPTLKQSETRQAAIQTDVSETASQLSRSARHEERLGNQEASKWLEKESKQVEQIANKEIDASKQQLATATENAKRIEAENAAENRDRERPTAPNLESAKPLMESAEKLHDQLLNRANELNDQLAKSESDSAAKSKAQSDQSQTGNEPKNSAPSNSSDKNATPSQPADGRQGAEAESEARQMAQTLDELDRKLNASGSKQSQSQSEMQSSSEGNSESQDSQNSNQNESNKEEDNRDGSRSKPNSSLQSAANQLAGKMNQERLAMRESESNNSQKSEKNNNAKDASQTKGNPGRAKVFDSTKNAFTLPERSKGIDREWGRLRDQRADDVIEGRREEFDPEYSAAIKAYYKGLGKKK